MQFNAVYTLIGQQLVPYNQIPHHDCDQQYTFMYIVQSISMVFVTTTHMHGKNSHDVMYTTSNKKNISMK